MDDWRRDNDTNIMSTPLDMTTLISRLHRSPGDQHHDVSFRLPDGSEVGGHKLVLAVASPVFESQFYGPMAAENTDVVTVKEVDSKAFRLLLECVYNSGPVESWDLTPDDYWNLFSAAHLYSVPVLMMHCELKLSEYAQTLKNDANKLIHFINKAQTLSISEKLSKIGLDLIKKDPTIHHHYCEAQARVRQGLARDGCQGERPQSLNPCLELTLKLVATHHHHPPTTHHPDI